MRLSRPRHAAWKGRPSAACGGRARVPGRSPRSSSWTLDSGTRSGSPTNETAGRYSPGSLLLSLLRRHRSPEPGTLPGPGAAAGDAHALLGARRPLPGPPGSPRGLRKRTPFLLPARAAPRDSLAPTNATRFPALACGSLSSLEKIKMMIISPSFVPELKASDDVFATTFPAA